MSKSKTLVQMIAIILQGNGGKRLTGKALAEAIVHQNPEWANNKRAKSRNPIVSDGGDDEIIAQVQSEIGSNKPAIEKHANLRMTEDRPRRYYFTKLSEVEEVEAIESEPNQASEKLLSEHDLYPLLAKFLKDEFGINSKRIDEKRSSNKFGRRGNHWLYPDLIGFEAISLDWSPTIQAVVQSRSDAQSILWSFEVKKLINRSNVREVFFQTLSNSAWANVGYLVAEEISGSGTLEELRMLSAQHGIGVVQLSTDKDTESSILIQADFRSEVDWTAANRLSQENSDAEAVFNQVRVFHQSNEINSSFWDA